MVGLSPAGRESLLGLARSSIRQAIQADGSLPRLLDRTELTPELRQPRGAFISLKQLAGAGGGAETLRGCIGSVLPREPLYETVIRMAPKAALDDPRFPPLSAEELPLSRIEISVLTALTPLANPEDLVVGRDGVQLVKGEVSALFLPQVARENAWDTEKLLRQLALKAGLKEDAWNQATLSVFQAEVFGE